jgi:hypothetical protein
MGTIQKVEQFMKYVCKKYEENDTFRGYGQFPSVLIKESGIDFGNALAQAAITETLVKQGFLEEVTKKGKRGSSYFSLVRPTFEGLRFVKDRKKSVLQKEWPKVISAITEGLIKGLKG